MNDLVDPDSRDIDYNPTNKEKSDKFGTDDGQCKLYSETQSAHPEVRRESPKEETPGVGKVGAKVDLERQVDHGEEQGDGHVQQERYGQSV